MVPERRNVIQSQEAVQKAKASLAALGQLELAHAAPGPAIIINLELLPGSVLKSEYGTKKMQTDHF